MALESQLSAQVTRGGCGEDLTSAARRTKQPHLESGQKLKTRFTQHPVRTRPQWSKDWARPRLWKPSASSSVSTRDAILPAHVNLAGNSVPKPQTAWVLLVITHWAKVTANFFKATHAPGTSKENTTTQIGGELCHPLTWKMLGLPSTEVISSGLAVVYEMEYSTK